MLTEEENEWQVADDLKEARMKRWQEWSRAHKKERSEYSKVQNMRQRDEVHEWLGGSCFVCGSRNALEIHHLRDRHGTASRVFSISEARRNPRGLVLLCFKHHKVIHAGNLKSYRLLKWLFEVARASSYRMNLRELLPKQIGKRSRTQVFST